MLLNSCPTRTPKNLSTQRKSGEETALEPPVRLSLLARLEAQIAALSCFPIPPLLLACSHNQRRHRDRFPDFVKSHKCEECLGGMFAQARHGIFREDLDAHF